MCEKGEGQRKDREGIPDIEEKKDGREEKACERKE